LSSVKSVSSWKPTKVGEVGVPPFPSPILGVPWETAVMGSASVEMFKTSPLPIVLEMSFYIIGELSALYSGVVING